MHPDSFWRETPRTLKAIMEGRALAAQRNYEQRAWLAWTIAALGRVKKMPKLREVLRRPKPSRRKSWEEQLSIAKAWTAAIGRAPTSEP